MTNIGGVLKSLGIVAGLVTALGFGRAEPAPLEVQWSETGMIQLTWQGHPWIAASAPAVQTVILEHRVMGNGLFQEQFEKVAPVAPETTFDAASCRLTQRYPWGVLTVDYETGLARLDLQVTLSNQSDRTLAHFEVTPLVLALPEALDHPKEWKGDVAMPGEPGLVEAVAGVHRLVLGSDTVMPLRIGFGKPARDGRELPIVVRGGVRMMEPGGVQFYPYGLPRIEPGKSLTVRLALHFGRRGEDTTPLDEEAIAAFRRYHTPRLFWADRRPIAAIFLPTSKGPECNPRNWFNRADLDIRTEDGRTELRRLMMGYTDSCLKQLKAVNAQGMIVWNPEGGEHPHPITYIGDPRMVKILAPEMEDILPDFFAKIREAGFRVGCCLRPSQVYFNEKKGEWAHGTGSHGPDRNPLNDDFSDIWPEGLPWWRFFPIVERMSRKIAYARQRWGATLFYVDTNGIFANEGEENKMPWTLLDSHIWRELHRRHPDVLFIPELRGSTAQNAYTAQYLQPPYSSATTPVRIREILPGAFGVSYTVNLPLPEWEAIADTLREGLRQGDSLFFRGWFGCAYNAKIKALYDSVYPPGAINPGLPFESPPSP